jgi:hypothetical protein
MRNRILSPMVQKIKPQLAKGRNSLPVRLTAPPPPPKTLSAYNFWNSVSKQLSMILKVLSLFHREEWYCKVSKSKLFWVYIHTSYDTTKIKKKLFLLYTVQKAIMFQVRMKVLLHAGILSFDHFEIYGWSIINALQCFERFILVVLKNFCE